MGSVKIDDDILVLLNQMRAKGEDVSDVIRRLLLAIPEPIEFATKEEFDLAVDSILDRYHDLLQRLAS